MKELTFTIWLLICGVTFAAGSGDLPSLVADRAEIERVYHEHRIGTKVPFDQAMPRALLEKLTRAELKKEAVLAHVYGVKITDTMVAAEVQRIDTTTRAPETLAEIKVALGNDAVRYAASFVRPIIVERLLHDHFENDDALHAPQRRAAEALRLHLLEIRETGVAPRLAALKECHEGEVQEQVTWELTPRPSSDSATPPATPAPATEGKSRGGAYSNEATAQLAQTLSSPEKPGEENDRKYYFEDLPGDLQKVLRVQLRQPGDVSAVIESMRGFQLYLARERSATAVSVAVLTIPKRGYDEWLAQQPEP